MEELPAYEADKSLGLLEALLPHLLTGLIVISRLQSFIVGIGAGMCQILYKLLLFLCGCISFLGLL